MKSMSLSFLVAVFLFVNGHWALGQVPGPGDPVVYFPLSAVDGALASSESGEESTKFIELNHCIPEGGGYPMYTCECLDSGVKYIVPEIRNGQMVCLEDMPATGWLGSVLHNCSLKVINSQNELCMVNDNWYVWDTWLPYDCPSHHATNIEVVFDSLKDHPEPGCCAKRVNYTCAY